jgi:hypothetical protein
MTIVEKIRASIQRVHGDGFAVYYHDDPTMNIIADTMTLPAAIVQLITQGELDQTSGQWREVVSAAVFFVDRSEFDFDADENEKIIDACKRRALRWLAGLQLDEDLTLVRWERTSRVYERFDAILTGFAVMVDLLENEGVTDCPTVPYDFNNDFNNDFLIAI